MTEKTMTLNAEAKLAQQVVDWLRRSGWETYHEVQIAPYNCRADIVAVRKNQAWVIETKTSMGFAVLAQADNWVGHVHRVSVAVPVADSRNMAAAEFIAQVCRSRDIGWLEVSKSGGVSERLASRIYSEPSDIGLFGVLNESQKETQAGNSSSDFDSPFGRTCRRVSEYVADNPGKSPRYVAVNVEHHYSTPEQATRSLLVWSKAGSIEGVEARRIGGRWRLYPKGAEA